MKSILNVFMILMWTITYNGQAQNNYNWQMLNEGEGSFGGIDFVSEDIGFMLFEHHLKKTVDGGATWNLISETGPPIYIMDFITESTGWCSNCPGDSVRIYRTTDGGNNWQIKNELNDIESFHAVSDSVFFALGHEQIFKTIDGGDNWINIDTPADSLYFRLMWFFNADSGIVICLNNPVPHSWTKGSIYKTFDGGQNWIRLPMPEFNYPENLEFINDSTGYFLSQNNIWITTEGFNTWSQFVKDYSGYKMLNKDTIFAVNGDSNFVRSSDGGLTWQSINKPSAGSPCEIYLNSNQDLYVISDAAGYSNLWKTPDLGNNWEIQIFSYPFTDIFFVDHQKGFLTWGGVLDNTIFGSYYGGIFSTDDGGVSWEKVLEPNNSAIFNCSFTNDSSGYLLGNHMWIGFILKSIDYGENWSEVYSSDPLGYNYKGHDLHFMNQELGWAVGNFRFSSNNRGAGILETTDGGENWNLVLNINNRGDLYSIHARDSIAWAVGSGGMIVKYTFQDQWQLQNSIPNVNLYNVFFSDRQHGWISGGNTLFKTVNAGDTWIEVPGFNYGVGDPYYGLGDMYFADSLHGWIVGADTSRQGIILETFDGGENWNIVIEGLSAGFMGLTAIHIQDSVGWVVGDNGLILRTDNWTTWVDQNSGEIYPGKYKLSQNYPNPFNPSTTIEFSTPKTERVTLKIYNILGEIVETLVSEKLAAGTYQYEWDATQYASGVYIYRLEAGKFTVVKKMIVLK